MTVRQDVWPQMADYRKAVRSLPAAFGARPDLAGGTLRAGPTPGFPWSAAGANAIVFSMRTASGGQVALRCFTRRPPNDVDERYRALGVYVRANPCPVFAGFDWADEAIVVDGRSWPMLQMEWIDGASLKAFVAGRLERRGDLEQLSDTWRAVVAQLEARGVAHGDLQHGNVIVDSPESMRLVDLDEVYCSATRRFGTNESGLPSYQHPERARSRAWDEHIDRFSSLVIYTSLRAIATARDPHGTLAPGDALVLSADDIKAAAAENARDQAWEHLLLSPDPDVRHLAGTLHEACRMRLDEVPSLDDVVRRLPAAASAPLNTWPPVAATVGSGADGDGDLAVDGHRRSHADIAPQSWAGQRLPPPSGMPAAPPAAPRSTAARRRLVLLGLVLVVGGIALAATVSGGGGVAGVLATLTGVALVVLGLRSRTRVP